MKAELTRQIYLFILFIFNGSIIGVFFDIFRILRKSFKTNDLITSIQDILFCVITGIFLIYSIFIFNNGEIRLYVIIGLLIGLSLYMLLLSKHIIKISVCIIKFLKKIFSFVIHIISVPIKILISILKKPCTFILTIIKKALSKIRNIKHKLLNKKEKSHKNVKNIEHKEGF